MPGAQGVAARPDRYAALRVTVGVASPRMDDQLDAVVVGGAGVDTNVYLAGDDIDWSVETNFTRNVDCVGQAGGYSSRLFARLGKRACYIGPVGDDHGGRAGARHAGAPRRDLTGLFVDAGARTAASTSCTATAGARTSTAADR